MKVPFWMIVTVILLFGGAVAAKVAIEDMEQKRMQDDPFYIPPGYEDEPLNWSSESYNAGEKNGNRG